MRAGARAPLKFPQRCIVGTVRLLGVVCYEGSDPVYDGCDALTAELADRALESEWFIGPVAWVLDDPQPCSPIIMPGKLQLWSLPAEVSAQLTAVR
jgi:hypothetical protein